jgi:hypothetical protein
LIKKFKARGARHPLSPYLLVFTPSARRHFILHLSIFPLPLSLSFSCTEAEAEAAGCRRWACIARRRRPRPRRHATRQAWRRHAHTDGGASEAWRGGVVLVPMAARARWRERGTTTVARARRGAAERGGGGSSEARWSVARWRHACTGSGVSEARRRHRGPPGPSILERHPRLLASCASSPRLRTVGRTVGSRSRRCGAQGRPRGTSTTSSSSPPSTTVATFLDSDDFFRSTATTTSHLSAWPTMASSSLNAWIWALQARIWVVDFFYFQKKLLSIDNNRYHKETGFHIGQIDYLNRYNKYDRYYNRVLY